MRGPQCVLTLLLIFAVTASVRAELGGAVGYQGQVEMTALLKTTTTAADQPIVYPPTNEPEVSIIVVEIPPGGETGWHSHPYPIFVYSLSGELSISFENGKTHHLLAGEAMMECLNMFHNGKNVGTAPVKLVISVMGEKGKPFTVRQE
jgi:quercetin dioxygenase-like cupin family protein